MVKYTLTLLFIAIGQLLFCQTANITEGCIPLEVRFEAENLNSYYWDFGDLTTSNLQNPIHIFTSDGIYNVELFNGLNGQSIGSIAITVYPDIGIEITADQVSGCEPLQVTFNLTIDHDPEINITGFKWVFGDGNTSNLESPTHTYSVRGVFNVSVEVYTDLTECNAIVIEQDLITVVGVEAAFEYEFEEYCTTPTSIQFYNLSEHLDGNLYQWNFGNNTSSTSRNPEPVIYNTAGTYEVTLTVISTSGCTSTYIDEVTLVDQIDLEINVPDSLCRNELRTLVGDNRCKNHSWILPNGNDGTDTFFDSLGVDISYSISGDKIFSYRCYTSDQCFIDTSFTIHIESPNANFILTPELGCQNPQIIQLEALDNNHNEYTWNGIPTDSPIFLDTIYCPKRDSFYQEKDVNYPYILTIESENGCISQGFGNYISTKPNACFKISPNNGCVPLTVSFDDFSFSEFDIIRWKWDLGDGTIINQTEQSLITHTYTDPGEYYSKLIVENSEGCIDTSYGVWTYVGVPIDAEFIFQDNPVCRGDTIQGEIINKDNRLDSWYLGGGVGIVSLCEETASSIVYQPGTFPSYLMTEYNGCFNKIPLDSLTVLGAYADINYSITCSNPTNVDFWEVTTLHDSSQWYINDELVSTEPSFTHSFSQSGSYTITLISSNNDGCDPSIDQEVIYITNIKANLTGPDTLCPNQLYNFDASNSIDVDNDAYSGYKYFGNFRPLITDQDTFKQAFSPGDYVMYLEVTDINGCTNVDSFEFNVVNISADYALEVPSICTEGTYNFVNTSTSDYPIQNFEWNFDEYGVSNEENPIVTISTLDIDSTYEHILYITDSFGCQDSITKTFPFFDFSADINVMDSQRICLGDTMYFSANNIMSSSKHFTYHWNFGDNTQSIDQSPTKVYLESGEYLVSLTITEVNTGCVRTDFLDVRVVELPKAQFATNIDGDSIICYPEIIDFYDESTTDGPVIYTWYMGDEDIVKYVESPSFTFDKGTHEVILEVESIYGCEDFDTTLFTLVGPEGFLSTENDLICLNDSVVVSLTNLEDVSEYTWDMGDGTTYEGMNPITHRYSFSPFNGSTIIKAILKSELNGCETILEHPINITDVSAAMIIEQSDINCGLSVNLLGESDNADLFEWSLSDGTTYTNPEITHPFSNNGTYQVTLKATDSKSGCFTEINEEVGVKSLENGFAMPNIFTPNDDGTNDYFKPIGLDVIEEDLEIKTFEVYNRWGNLVYNNENGTEGWDGKYQNSEAPSEVYAYYISIEIKNCGIKSQQGNVTIIR